MKPEIKEAKREGYDSAVFEKWTRDHSEWLRLFLNMNKSMRGSLAVRKVYAYKTWLKSHGPEEKSSA
jgi:hypothetical protein